MTARRIRLIAAGAAVVAVVALAWLLGISPLLGQAASSETQLAATTAVNDAQAARLAALAASSRDLTALQAEVETADSALPAEPALAAFFTELGDLQQRYDVTVTAYTGADAVAAGTTAAPAPAATPAPGATPIPSATPTPAAAAAAPATPATPATGLSRIPMTLQLSGSYKHLVSFLGGLQTGPRFFLVDKTAITAGADGAGFTAAVSGAVYVLPTGSTG